VGDVSEPQRFGEEDLYRLAEEFVHGIAEELCRHRIYELDGAFVVDDHDAIGGRVDDADQQLIGQLMLSR
jgi:hypothetical protein